MSLTEKSLTDTVNPGTYNYSIYPTANGIDSSRSGQFTFDQTVTGQQAMHLIANSILTAEGRLDGSVYRVEWLYLDGEDAS